MPPVMVSVGDDSRWGAFLLSAYTWKPNKNVDVTVHADERTERGLAQGRMCNTAWERRTWIVNGLYLNDANPYQGGDRFEESHITDDRYTWRVAAQAILYERCYRHS